MPYCRHCHEEISKFDTDICPHCGGAKPIAAGYQTMDVTKTFGTMQGDFEMPKTRSQKVFAILCMTLGYFGIHEFYIYRKKVGFFELLATLILVGGGGTALFLTIVHNAFAYLIPFLILWVIYVVRGIYYLKVESPKDGKGDFLR